MGNVTILNGFDTTFMLLESSDQLEFEWVRPHTSSRWVDIEWNFITIMHKSIVCILSKYQSYIYILGEGHIKPVYSQIILCFLDAVGYRYL